ncbi:hypothetical protein AB0B45_02555 [Nonomuraea sp. NPDC049152]|uniref:hypothetical protein n=1 Tax=Nonomuraea sp. NPDC049152 TaxID=3154350 RepID=UPI0033D7E154
MTNEQTELRTLTDWRGNPYTIGTTIFYPRGSSGSIEIQEAEVIDIWDVVTDPDTYDWARFDPDNPKHQGLKRTTRVKVQPTGRSSRPSNYQVKRDEQGEIVRDEDGHPEWEQYEVEHKPVTLLIIGNVTVVDTCTHGRDAKSGEADAVRAKWESR